MPDTIPDLPTGQRAVDRTYQPLAGLAVAAGVAALLTAILAAQVAGSVLILRRPLLVPEYLVPAVAGVALALAARWQIARSEGTRAGGELAAAAGWLCAVCGAGYVAYLTANEFVVRQQVVDEAGLWFDDLKAGRTKEAFFRTLTAGEQADLKPDDPSFDARYAEQLAEFRQAELVQLFERAGGDARVENLGPRSIVLEADVYRAQHNFRLETPEGRFGITATLAGGTVRATGRRFWRVLAGGQTRVDDRAFTDFGRLQIALQSDGTRAASAYLAAVRRPGQIEAYLLTRPLTERLAVAAAARLSGAAALALHDERAAETLLPGLADYRGGALAVVKPPAPSGEADRRAQKGMLATVFREGRVTPPASVGPAQPSQPPRVVFDKDRVGLVGPVELQLPLPSGLTVASTLHAELFSPDVLAEAKRLRGESWPQPATQSAGTGGQLDSGRPRDWRVTRIETALQPSASKPTPAPPVPGG